MKVKFLLDENMPFALIDFLKHKGFITIHLKTIGKQGIKNGEVYKLAEEQKMWIITRDADFQNLQKFVSYDVAGIIVIKISLSRTKYLLNVINLLLNKYQDKLDKKHLIVVDDNGMKLY